MATYQSWAGVRRGKPCVFFPTIWLLSCRLGAHACSPALLNSFCDFSRASTSMMENLSGHAGYHVCFRAVSALDFTSLSGLRPAVKLFSFPACFLSPVPSSLHIFNSLENILLFYILVHFWLQRFYFISWTVKTDLNKTVIWALKHLIFLPCCSTQFLKKIFF